MELPPDDADGIRLAAEHLEHLATDPGERLLRRLGKLVEDGAPRLPRREKLRHARLEKRLLRRVMTIERSGARSKPHRSLDVGYRGPLVAPLRKQPHRFVENSVRRVRA